MDKLYRNKKTIFLFIAPALILYIIVLIVPIISSIYYSFFKWNILNPMKFIGFSNYIRMFTSDDVVKKSIINVLLMLVVALLGQELVAFFISIALTSHLKGAKIFKNLFFMPAVLSSTAVGLMWVMLYDSKYGLIDVFLRNVGLSGFAKSWLTDPHTALWSLCAVSVWQFIGNSMIIFISAIQTIPESLFEAAKIDGASYLQTARKITVPLMQPIIKINTVLIAVGTLKTFDLTYVMTGGGPDHATEVLASIMYTRAFKMLEYGYGDSISVILLIMCLLVTFIIMKAFKSETYQF